MLRYKFIQKRNDESIKTVINMILKKILRNNNIATIEFQDMVKYCDHEKVAGLHEST